MDQTLKCPKVDKHTKAADSPIHLRGPARPEAWPVLVVESVHLLGLVLAHAQNTQNAHTITALYDQFIRHLHLLRKMPGQAGELLLYRTDQHCRNDGSASPIYTIVFGKLIIPEPSIPPELGSKNRTSQLWKTLNQAFKFFEHQAIHSFYLRLPNESSRESDQLRLALNIAARYRKAADTLSSITFRYFGRVVNVPLIYANDGRPDPNLTIMAGLNGLASVNVRSLMRQADAICALVGGDENQPCPESSFEQVFSLRNFRTHLIKPFIEINNHRWGDNVAIPGCDATSRQKNIDNSSIHMALGDGRAAVQARHGDHNVFTIENSETKRTIQPLLDVVLSDDYADIDAQEFGRRLLYASRLLSELQKNSDNTHNSIILLQLLREKFEHAPELVVRRIKKMRGGLKIAGTRKALVIGLIHPDLLDLISLERERLSSKEKYAAVESFERSDKSNDEQVLTTLAAQFGYSTDETRRTLASFLTCYDNAGRFCNSRFGKRIQEDLGVNHAMFEVLWYFFKVETIEHNSNSCFRAIKQATARLLDKKAALRLLLTDLLQAPFDLSDSDHYALFFANMILRIRNQEQHSKIDYTPFEVLRVKRGLIAELQHYAAKRLEFDQVVVLTKMRTIHDRLKQILRTKEDDLILKECQDVLRLEREALLFAALIGGNTARMVLCGVFSQYDGLVDHFSQSGAVRGIIQSLLDNLHIAVKGLQRIGQREDLDFLKQLDNTMIRLNRLDDSPDYNRSVQRLMARIGSAVKSIQLHAI